MQTKHPVETMETPIRIFGWASDGLEQRWAHFALKRPPALCLFRKSPPASSASHYFFSQAPEPLYPIPPPLQIDLGGRLRSSRSLRSAAPPPIQPSRISGSRRWPSWRPSSRVVVLDGGGPRPDWSDGATLHRQQASPVASARTGAIARRFIGSRIRRQLRITGSNGARPLNLCVQWLNKRIFL